MATPPGTRGGRAERKLQKAALELAARAVRERHRETADVQITVSICISPRRQGTGRRTSKRRQTPDPKPESNRAPASEKQATTAQPADASSSSTPLPKTGCPEDGRSTQTTQVNNQGFSKRQKARYRHQRWYSLLINYQQHLGGPVKYFQYCAGRAFKLWKLAVPQPPRVGNTMGWQPVMRPTKRTITAPALTPSLSPPAKRKPQRKTA